MLYKHFFIFWCYNDTYVIYVASLPENFGEYTGQETRKDSMISNPPADNIENPQKQPLNTFESNKHFLRLALNKFANDIDNLSDLITDMADDYSDLRFKLCETFRLFGNGRSRYAGADGDVQSLCQGVIYGHVKNKGRIPKSLMLNKIQKMIEANDVAGFINQCQSIYRAAEENEHIDYYEYVNYQQSYSIDPWDMLDKEVDEDYDSVAIFEQLEAARIIKAGNLHHRYRPLNGSKEKEDIAVAAEVTSEPVSHETFFTIPRVQIFPCNNIFETPSSQFLKHIESANPHNFRMQNTPGWCNSS